MSVYVYAVVCRVYAYILVCRGLFKYAGLIDI